MNKKISDELELKKIKDKLFARKGIKGSWLEQIRLGAQITYSRRPFRFPGL